MKMKQFTVVPQAAYILDCYEAQVFILPHIHIYITDIYKCTLISIVYLLFHEERDSLFKHGVLPIINKLAFYAVSEASLKFTLP